jgi:outer membrane lipoprotein
LGAVRAAPSAAVGKSVRWGGNIVSVRNLKTETQLEIVGRRLDGDGRPRDENRSDGRFLANVSGFLDPLVYKTGRDVTVNGHIEGTIDRAIGEFAYTYPVVRAADVHLWEVPTTSTYPPYYYPYYYDFPFGDPFWPYYRPRFYR